MNNPGTDRGFPAGRIRLIIFITVAILHVVLILSVAFHIRTSISQPEPVAGVMRLFDIEEALPPPPPDVIPETIQTNTEELVAENMIETDEEPPPVISSYSGPIGTAGSTGAEHINYLRMSEITVSPGLPEDQIVRNTVYPPIAQRSNKEGVVFLELFIDRQGNVRQVNILREDPPDHGFGQAAVNAFRGIRGKPAEANGEPVAVRFRYRFTFKLN